MFLKSIINKCHLKKKKNQFTSLTELNYVRLISVKINFDRTIIAKLCNIKISINGQFLYTKKFNSFILSC